MHQLNTSSEEVSEENVSENFFLDQQFDPDQVRWSVTLRAIQWSVHYPAENFFLLKGHIETSDTKKYPCYMYYPDPSTKSNHFFPKTVLEIIAPPIPFSEGMSYGQVVTLIFPNSDFILLPRRE